MAHLQQGAALAGLWQDLWDQGPPSLRGLIIFGWARAQPEQALEHLGTLADDAGHIDLPTTMWSLVGPDGVGIIPVGKSARHVTEVQWRQLRKALATSGADDGLLSDFNQYSDSARFSRGAGKFQFPDGTTPANRELAKRFPRWSDSIDQAA